MGHLDLFVVNYLVYSLDVPYRPCGEDGIQTYCHPSLFEGGTRYTLSQQRRRNFYRGQPTKPVLVVLAVCFTEKG